MAEAAARWTVGDDAAAESVWQKAATRCEKQGERSFVTAIMKGNSRRSTIVWPGPRPAERKPPTRGSD
jgi:hypothetical protein